VDTGQEQAVANRDHHEGHQEAADEAGDGRDELGEVLVMPHGLVVQDTGGLFGEDVETGGAEDEGGEGEERGQEPGSRASPPGQAQGPVVLAPHRAHHQGAPVGADDHQEEDAGKHVEDGEGGQQLAGEATQRPVVVTGQRQGQEGQGQAAEEVGHGEVEEPDAVHRAPQLETGHPDDSSVAQNAQEEDDGVERQDGTVAVRDFIAIKIIHGVVTIQAGVIEGIIGHREVHPLPAPNLETTLC